MLQGYDRFIFAFVALVVSEVVKPQLDEFTRGEELIYLPVDYLESNSYPLVILLHAYGMDTSQAESIWRFTESISEYNFIYAVPSGTLDQDGSYFWNSNSACCIFYNSSGDDVSYLHQYIKR